MHLTLKTSPLAEIAADWLIVPLWENERLTGKALEADTALDGVIAKLCGQGDVVGQGERVDAALSNAGSPPNACCFWAWACATRPTTRRCLSCTAAAAKMLSAKPYQRSRMALPDGVPTRTRTSCCARVRRAFIKEQHRRHSQEQDRSHAARRGLLSLCRTNDVALQEAVQVAPTSKAGRRTWPASWSTCRRAISIPRRSPSAPARSRSRGPASRSRSSTRSKLAAERMDSLLGVARLRSAAAPGRAAASPRRRRSRRSRLVGKGVTFDSGGLSLKTTDQMVDMKCDMAGAAAVLGAMQAIAELQVCRSTCSASWPWSRTCRAARR